MARTWGAAALAGALVGCGPPSGGASFAVPSPAELGLQCAEPGYAFTNLGITAYIAGGYPACELDVDPVTLQGSGVCPDVVVGAVRPILVVYTRGATQAEPAVTLAFLVGSVDLRAANLPADPADPVVAVLDAGGLLYTRAQLDEIEIPGDDCRLRDDGDPLQWAACYIRDELVLTLSCDGGPDNLVRACQGDLSC